MNCKTLVAIVCYLFVFVTPVIGDISFQDSTYPHYFPDSNIIILPIQNATNFSTFNSTANPPNTLQLWINNSRIRFNADINKTLHNISYNNVTDVWKFNGSGASGYLNVTTIVKYANTVYDLQVNGTTITSVQSAEDKVVKFNYTEAGDGLHEFQISNIDTFTPPNPINLAASTGNFWINHTWQPGVGNVTDSYNINFNNGSWYNGSSNTYSNNTLTPHARQNITVWGFNNSGSNLSAGNISLNTSIPNNAITITNVSSSYTKSAGYTLYIDANYVDADSDTGTFATTATKGTFNTTTGVLTWTTTVGDAGMYNWAINVTDGYGSVSTQAFTVTVSTAGVPAITKYNQTYTGDGTLYKPVTSGSTVQFNILETSGVYDTYNWQVDGVTVSNNLPNYSRVFTHGASGNNHRVVAWISGDLGNSNSIEWRMPVMAAMATTPVATLNETAYDNVETAVRSYDFISFMGAVVGGYTDVVGNVFYLFLWLTIFGMYWFRQKSITIPSVLGFIMGGALITMLPEEYQNYAIAIIGFGGFSLLYFLVTERRQ